MKLEVMKEKIKIISKLPARELTILSYVYCELGEGA